ncbi:hypothetical protein [Streptosporangium sp. NPDC006007]|uniref:hypothetical protein n=1 Tax=Streptosporangium sp. NPDC006007 TaxID=3154575 RepID=UPI0033AA7E68
MRPEVRVTAEWALWGKPPDARDDYEVLECSRGNLGRDEFSEIMTRYAPGTPTELPQVTISWFGGGDSAHLGLAIQKWSGQQDGLGRDIAITRYFCVPYRQAADGPVSYEALYDAFDGRELWAGAPLTVDVPALDLQAIAERVDKAAKSAAALLLTGEPVCVVRGESLSMRERLRFLDVVAALLPYGLRARLTASTWTDSSARHRIKLSFAKRARDGAHSVTWDADDVVSSRNDVTSRYVKLLDRYPCDELVSRLAEKTAPLSFKDAGPVLALLDGPSNSAPPVPAGWGALARSEVGDILNACADRLEHGGHGELEKFLLRLGRLPIPWPSTDDEQNHRREIIKRGGLLSEQPALSWDLKELLYDVILTVGYGPTLTLEGVNHPLDDAGTPTRTLVEAMLRMKCAPGVALKLVFRLDGESRTRALRSLRTGDLVRAAVREPFDPSTLSIVCQELVTRGSGAEDPEIAPALREHGYLAAAVEQAFPHGDARLSCLRKLLIAAYGPTLERGAFDEVVGSPLTPCSATLIIAAVSLYGPDAPNALVSGLLDHARLTAESRAHVLDLLAPRPDDPPAPRGWLSGRVLLWTHRHEPEAARPEQLRPARPGHRQDEPLWPIWAKVGLGATFLVAVVVAVVIRFW